ncbi:MAG: hypothetical protein AAF517_26565, partial [Planctomycetota bacterium]
MATPPKEHRAHTTYMVTKRTMYRFFFLKALGLGGLVENILLYTLGYFLQKHELLLHGYVFMWNHFHISLTDLSGKKPKFFEAYNNVTARAINRLLGRRGPIWDKESPNYLECVEKADIVDKAAYALANPVLAGLCRSRHAWNGAISSDHLLGGKVLRVKKPRIFFSRRMPDFVEIRLSPPPGFETLEAWRVAVTEAADAKEEEARRERARSGRRFPTKKELARVPR